MTASCLYEGELAHRRLAPRRHSFRYRLALAYVDVEELDGLVDGRLLRPGFGVWRFRRADYFGDPAVALGDAIRSYVHAQSGVRVTGPVRVLTQLRCLGHCFNPVSFYYCFDDSDTVAAVVADVTNTPWGERHAYVLTPDEAGRLAGSFPKRMHVSPFFGMDQTYRWWTTQPGESLRVCLGNTEHDVHVFDATLKLHRRPLNRQALRWVALRYPLASLRTLTLIYAHAVALRLKGLPVVPHPGVKAP